MNIYIYSSDYLPFQTQDRLIICLDEFNSNHNHCS